MLQVLSYREFVSTTGETKVSTSYFLEVPSILELYQNYASLLLRVPERDRENLHYTLAHCEQGSRNFLQQDTIAFDIDGFSEGRLEDYIMLISSLSSIDRASFCILKSGGGLHLVAQTSEPFAHTVEELRAFQKYWWALGKKINQALLSAGLDGNLDYKIIKPSGTLRFPGSTNAKYDPPRVAEVIQVGAAPIDFDVKALVSLDAPVESDNKYPEANIDKIREKCDFIENCFTNPDSVKYPDWVAALSIVSKCKGGMELAHKMSEGHSGYTWKGTQSQYLAAENLGPYKCSTINSDFCNSCPNFSKDISPIVLGAVNDARSRGYWIWDIKDGVRKRIAADYDALIEDFYAEFKCVGVSGNMFSHNGKFYRPISEERIKSWCYRVMDPSPSASTMREFALRLEAKYEAPGDEWASSSEGYINLSNGVLELSSMTLKSHSMEHFFTSCASYDFDPQAQCPQFDQFMKNVTLDDTDMTALLMEYMGYALGGMEYIHHKCLILDGGGSNGKSTFLDIMRQLGGPGSSSSLAITKLNDPVSLYNMVGKLFNVSSETPRKGFEDSATFKQITAGETYTAKALYKQPIEVANRTKIIIACNELPSSHDASEGFFRRLIIVPFEAHFTEATADKHIKGKLLAELPGILNKVIAGWRRLNDRNGFSECERVSQHVSEYREEQDGLGSWVRNNFVYDSAREDWVVAVEDVVAAYNKSAQDRGVYRISSKAVGQAMKRAFGTKSILKRDGQKVFRVYQGISPGSPALQQHNETIPF